MLTQSFGNRSSTAPRTRSRPWRTLRIAMLAMAVAIGCAAQKSTGLWEHPWRMGQLKAIRLGPAFQVEQVTPIWSVTPFPAQNEGKTVRIEGRIESVCDDAGCWADVWSLGGGGEGILVTSLHKVFSFPLDAVGRTASIEGRYSHRSFAPERVCHWSGHGWRPRLACNEPMRVHFVEATTVEIH